MSDTPQLVGVGSVFIDDIVLPTGQTYMGRLGGGVVHALMGAVVWDERPGIVGLTGQGLGETAEATLNSAFDAQGMIQLDIPQARAWQLFETDGTRREVPRVTDIEPFIEGPQPYQWPAVYDDSRAVYLLQSFDGIQAWGAVLDGLVLWEPLQQVMTPGRHSEMAQALESGCADIASPNLIEAQAVYDLSDPADLVRAMWDNGAKTVALRMGEQGSLVGQRDTGELHHIPAVTGLNVVDQTGAGNTYCGTLLAGLMHGRSLIESACMGTVAASFCVEQVGVLDPSQVESDVRDKRYETLLSLIKA